MSGLLVGVDGPIGSGKTTVCDILVKHHGFYPVNFADPLKDGLSVMLSEPRSNFEDRDLKEAEIPGLGITRRAIMQSLGNDWGRDMVGGIWVKIFERKVRNLIESGASVVVGDVRYDDAADLIRSLGGVILHVDRPGVVRSDHPSEQGVTFAVGDLRVSNSGTIEEMLKQVTKLYGYGMLRSAA